ncbi:MAG: ABC transporter ATP-binding protein, partial [Acidimicrobiales bacterium]
LSNLDAALRVQTRADIVALQGRLASTMLYVTHDQVEAMTMGHRIAVMLRGVLQQVAAPEELYRRPANTFVAGFLGSPGMNLVGGAVRPGPDEGATVAVPGGTIELGGEPARLAAHASSLVVGIRPEGLAVSPQGTVGARVLIVELLGAEVHVICELADGTRVVVRQEAGRPRPANGEPVRLSIDGSAVHLFDAEAGRRLETAS